MDKAKIYIAFQRVLNGLKRSSRRFTSRFHHLALKTEYVVCSNKYIQRTQTLKY